MSHESRRWLTTITLSLLGCGGPGGANWVPEPAIEAKPAALTTPLVSNIAPTRISAGQKLKVLGQRFVDPQLGHVEIAFRGTFTAASGRREEVNFSSRARATSQGELQWFVAPNIPFSRDNELGSFDGKIHVANVANDGTQKRAAPLDVHLEVGPSIIVESLQPADVGCQIDQNGTISETPIRMRLRAVGLDASPGDPIRFHYTFMKEQFRFDGYLTHERAVDPDSLFPGRGSVTLVDVVDSGTQSTLGARLARRVYVTRGGPEQMLTDTYVNLAGWLADREFGLMELRTAPLADPASNFRDSAISVLAVDGQGRRAARSVPLRVWAPVTIDYQGDSEVVRVYKPVRLTGCMFSDRIPSIVDYRETEVEERERGFTTTGGLDIASRFPGFVPAVEAHFGVSVQGKVRSAESRELRFSPEKLLPNHWGVFYRQTTHEVYIARLTLRGVCGDAQPAGDVLVNKWIWTPGFAQQRSGDCPPYPEPKMSAPRSNSLLAATMAN